MATYKAKYIIACFYFRGKKTVCFNIVDLATRSLHFEFSYPDPADKNRSQTGAFQYNSIRIAVSSNNKYLFFIDKLQGINTLKCFELETKTQLPDFIIPNNDFEEDTDVFMDISPDDKYIFLGYSSKTRDEFLAIELETKNIHLRMPNIFPEGRRGSFKALSLVSGYLILGNEWDIKMFNFSKMEQSIYLEITPKDSKYPGIF